MNVVTQQCPERQNRPAAATQGRRRDGRDSESIAQTNSMSSENTQPLSPPTPPTPRGPLLAPSHHRTSSTLQRHLETALAPATLNKRSASVTDQIELEEWWSLTPERLRRIFKEVDVDNDGR